MALKTMPAEPEILTAAEAMEFLRVPTTTFYRLLEQGYLPAFKVGRQWRFRRAVLMKWITDREEQTNWRVTA